MDLFESQWQTYRDVVDHDWMEHRGLTAACADALQDWVVEHPDRSGRIRLLDLGCGDLAQMGPVFRSLPLQTYVGVDLTEQVLPMAREALGPVPFVVEFHHADVVEFIGRPGEDYDLVHAALVLHHLGDDEKVRFLAALRGRMRPEGVLVWADVFREQAEARPDYVARYAERIRSGWDAIDADAREAIVTHMSAYDFPADRTAIVAAAERAGWSWQWTWQGSHRAEAVAVLTAV